MLTFFGGFIGIILGWVISFIITKTGIIQTEVSLFSVLLAFGVSAAIGIIFGYYPARRAAGLNPIEALRYEYFPQIHKSLTNLQIFKIVFCEFVYL